MTTRALASTILTGLVFAAACGGGNGADDDGTAGVDAGTEPAEGFRIQTPPIQIAAGEEVTYCYYTTLPAVRDMGIK